MSEEERERLSKFTDEDLHALMEMVKMYQAGRAAIFKAIVYAIAGAAVTAIGLGIKNCIQNIFNN